MAAYFRLHKQKRLSEHRERARSLLRNCTLYSGKCGTDRLSDKKGLCNARRYALIASYGPHYGEELSLVGRNGSDTIFFSNCNLSYVFCQNYAISRIGEGREQIIHIIAQSISPYSYINIMDHYHPCYKAHDYDKLNRSLSVAEYQSALNNAYEAGLRRLDKREVMSRLC